MPSLVTQWAFQVVPVVKNLPANTGDVRDTQGFDPWAGKIPWRKKWQPTPVFLSGKSHRWRSPEDYSPWGRKELNTTERLHFHFHFTEYKNMSNF